MKSEFPHHRDLIYSWNDPIWNAPPTTDDCIRLITGIVLQAYKDETKPVTGNNAMNGKQQMAHDSYLSSPAGLQEDCEIIGLDYSRIMEKMRGDNGK